MIKFENVGVVYPGGVKALENINLEINEGDFVIIVGLSPDYEAHLKSEGFLTPSGKVTGAGRLTPLARTDENWDK